MLAFLFSPYPLLTKFDDFSHTHCGSNSSASNSIATERIIKSTEITNRVPFLLSTRIPAMPANGPVLTCTHRPAVRYGYGSARKEGSTRVTLCSDSISVSCKAHGPP